MGRLKRRHLPAPQCEGLALCGRQVSSRVLIPVDKRTVRRWRDLVTAGRACQPCVAVARPLLAALGA